MHKLIASNLVLLMALISATGDAQERMRAHGTPVPESAMIPQWPKPVAPMLSADAPTVHSKDLELIHSRQGLGDFAIRVGGKPMAIGQNRPMIGYVIGDELKWLALSDAPNRKLEVRGGQNGIRVRFECSDADAGKWQIQQSFTPGAKPETIEVVTEIAVDQERQVAFLPMLMIFPGAGGFGESKGQGLVAGLEYLENEPGSSEADVVGPASKRQVPDNLKLTFPLMVVQAEDRYLAMTWQMRPQFCAIYDSPDRFFGSGGHVLGVLYPGSDGKNREEGNLLPRECGLMYAGVPLAARVLILGGPGKSVVPAVQKYIELRGWPPLPAPMPSLAEYCSLAAAGWLDSGIRETNRFHHAIAGGNFPAGPAADAGYWMDWLADHTSETGLVTRLKQTAREAIEAVPPADLNFAAVGHVRYPVGSLIYGDVVENAVRAGTLGHEILKRFESDGSIRYHAQPDGMDYSKTHYTNEANGLTSRSVLDLLEAAAVSGQQELLEAGLRELRAMNKFRDGVPRGAQTWECPLHTPDILASALMLRAYTLGYELSGDPELLEQARYWAWTGVPFVYLVNPTDRRVGLYATIAVLGATQWKAPVWLGLPVQWCGLVYAEALYRLVRDDPKGPWKRLADGITLSGIQQCWPRVDQGSAQPVQQGKLSELQGLLPDSFVLRTQHRNGPAINPSTVQACAEQYFSSTPIYDFWAFRKNGFRIHAPGAIRDQAEKPGRVSFEVEPALVLPYYVLVNGLSAKPELKINGKTVECAAPHEFHEKEGWLVLKLDGKAKVELTLPASSTR